MTTFITRMGRACPVNLAGLPRVAVPVLTRGALPASLRLIGPAYAAPLLIATAAVIEGAAARSSARGSK